MKKVQAIRNPEAAAKVPAKSTPDALPTLNENETTTLQVLVRERDKIMAAIGSHVGRALADRGLNPMEHAISISDYKTIVKAQQKQPDVGTPTAPANPPVNG